MIRDITERPELTVHIIHEGKLYRCSTHKAPVLVPPSDPGYAAGWKEAEDMEAGLEAERAKIEQLLAESDALIHRVTGGKFQ
jgi:hypothetical protein